MSARKIVMRLLSISFTMLLIVLVIFLLMKAGNAAYQFGYRIFTEEPVSTGDGRDVIVQIEQGMDDSDIGVLLENKGLVRDGRLFWAQLKLSAFDGDIKEGIYTLNTSMTPKEMMQVMSPAEEETEKENASDGDDAGGETQTGPQESETEE